MRYGNSLKFSLIKLLGEKIFGFQPAISYRGSNEPQLSTFSRSTLPLCIVLLLSRGLFNKMRWYKDKRFQLKNTFVKLRSRKFPVGEERIANGKSELIEAPSFLCTVYESAGKYPGLKETRYSTKKKVRCNLTCASNAAAFLYTWDRL